MQTNLILALGGISALLLVRNLYVILLGLPDEALQGAMYRIIFFHVPAAFIFMIAAFASMVASILFLVRKNFAYDNFAAAVTEVGLVFGTVNLVTGMIWGRIAWGIWWAWDARLTSMLVCWLLYSAYLMLRNSIDEPTQRARSSAALSIFAFPGVVITYKAIDWWRTQHPSPVLSIRGAAGAMDPAMEQMLYLNFVPLFLFAVVLLMLRMRQEGQRLELDAMRRELHAV